MTDAADSDDATRQTIDRFNQALNRHDIDAVMALMTDDCVFENTSPFPDGQRFSGQADVRDFWATFLVSSPAAHFDAEEIVTAGDRCVVRWKYLWENADGTTGHIRGIDLFKVRDGKVAEKLAYVKG
jgi:ketosteroid isomerase-like protein